MGYIVDIVDIVDIVGIYGTIYGIIYRIPSGKLT